MTSAIEALFTKAKESLSAAKALIKEISGIMEDYGVGSQVPNAARLQGHRCELCEACQPYIK
jgi:hypothetical protein